VGSENSIYNYEESLRNDQLPVYDEVVQLVLDGTNPPSYGVDISAARDMTRRYSSRSRSELEWEMETVTETEGLRDEMDKTAELAEQFGISGDDGDPEDEENY